MWNAKLPAVVLFLICSSYKIQHGFSFFLFKRDFKPTDLLSVFLLSVITVVGSAHSLSPPTFFHHRQRCKVSSPALFHTPLDIFFTEQDLQVIRAPHQLQRCYANVSYGLGKVERRGKHTSRAPIRCYSSFPFKGQTVVFSSSMKHL